MSRIHYPIEVAVKYRSDTIIKRLNADDEVRCFYCESVFPVKDNVIVTGMFDSKALHCPKCHKTVSVLYYFDRVTKHEKRQDKPLQE